MSSHLTGKKLKRLKPYNNGGNGGSNGGPGDGDMGDTWTGYLPGQGPSDPCWSYARDWPAARPGVHFFDMTCGDGPARLREKRGGAGVSRSCIDNNHNCDDCSAVSCDNSCIIYDNETHYPWWGASTSSTTGQAHCGCSPHCGCTNEQEYCGGTYNCYYAVCTNGTFDLVNCQGGPCNNCGTGYSNCWEVWDHFQSYFGQDGYYPNAADYYACGMQGYIYDPVGTMTDCYCDVCS